MKEKDNIYCGVGPLPKGKRRCTMIEAAEKNQVRYYGLNKIDKKLVDAYNKKLNPDSKTKKEKKEKQTLQEKYISVVVKINKMKNNIDKASTKV